MLKSKSLTLNALLDETTRRLPDKIALATETDAWTFSELRERALQTAAALRAQGVHQGDCVGLVLRNSPDFVSIYFALARLGAVVVPINFLITKTEELRFMLDDCSAVGVITQRDFLKSFLAVRRSLPALRLWTVDEPLGEEARTLGPLIERGDPASLPSEPAAAPGDVAAVLYTSGTTGSPKGVMLLHSNMVSNADAVIEALQLDEREVALCLLPMFHSFAWGGNVVTCLRLGAKLVIAASVTPPEPWLRLMARHGVTMFSAVPPIYSVLAAKLRLTGFKARLKALALRYGCFRKVRVCISGAAPLPPEMAEAFEAAMGVPILEGYGLTEAGPASSLNPPRRPRKGSIGRPIPGVRIKIVDDDERELPAGAEGEICIQGPNVMLGYRNRPDETREVFTKDGWFKSGDIGALDQDGYLYIRDRKKDMIIVKGLKVFSAQVEQVIRQHPDVAEAAVVGIPEETGDELIKAFIVPHEGARPDKTALLRFCRERLDAYKRPRDLEIVKSLPKNALQKVLKRVLRRQELEKRTRSQPGGH